MFRRYEPEIAFYVWCTWRLDSASGVVASSDTSEAEIAKGLHRLVGEALKRATVSPPAWDLTLEFTNDLVLKIFCDHAGRKPSFGGNWEATVAMRAVYAGPGEKLEIATVPPIEHRLNKASRLATAGVAGVKHRGILGRRRG
jgi:hypothetical protein